MATLSTSSSSAATHCSRIPKSQWFIVKVTIVGSIGGFLFGYDLGVISQALPLLTSQFSLRIDQQELFSSLILAGQIAGSLVGGYICDKMGRKGTIFFVCIIFIIGSCILTFAQKLETLYVGRFIVGIGVAISAIADVSYLTEVSPDRHRGAMVGANELMITIGLLGAYIIGYILSDTKEGWRNMFCLPIFTSLIWMILMFFLPESPKWLLVQGDEDRALEVYKARVDTESEAQEDFHQACTQVMKAKEADKLSIYEIIHFWRYSIITSILILLAQNLCGHISVLTYAPEIFKAAGLGKQGAGIGTIVLGVIKVIFTFTSMSLVDTVGRKGVLMVGIFGIIVALIGIISSVDHFSISQSTDGIDDDSGDASAVAGSGVIISIFVCILVASFALGYGPLSWLISSELFPDDIRGRALGMVTIANGLGSLIAVSSFLSMVATIGAQMAFGVYLIMTVLTFLFLLQCLPETYLRTPMDLHAELGDRYHSFSFTRILRECCGGHLYTSIHDHAPLLSSSSSPESSALYTERNHNSDYESSVSKSSNSGIYMSTTSLSSTSLLKPTPVYSKLHDEQDI